MTELAQPADRLHPAEDFFDALAHALTDVVAGVPRRPSVQRAAPLLEHHVRSRLELSQRFDEAVRVVGFVAADGDPSIRQTRDETCRGIAFGRTSRTNDAGVDHQAMPT